MVGRFFFAVEDGTQSISSRSSRRFGSPRGWLPVAVLLSLSLSRGASPPSGPPCFQFRVITPADCFFDSIRPCAVPSSAREQRGRAPHSRKPAFPSANYWQARNSTLRTEPIIPAPLPPHLSMRRRQGMGPQPPLRSKETDNDNSFKREEPRIVRGRPDSRRRDRGDGVCQGLQGMGSAGARRPDERRA